MTIEYISRNLDVHIRDPKLSVGCNGNKRQESRGEKDVAQNHTGHVILAASEFRIICKF